MSSLGLNLRAWPLAIALLAMLCSAMVPVGYMPDTSQHSGGLMSLRICTGMQMITVQVPADKYAIPGKITPTKHTIRQVSCDYAIGHIFKFLDSPAPFFVVLMFIFLALFLPEKTSFSERRYFGTLAARAPPAVS